MKTNIFKQLASHRNIAIAAGVVVLALILALVLYQRHAQDRINAGVSVAGVDLGGLTRDEAVSVLIASLPPADTRYITLHARGQQWRFTWSDIGQRYDYAGMAEAAYQVGRDTNDGGPDEDNVTRALTKPWGPSSPYTLTEQIIPPDPERLVSILTPIAESLAKPALDAQLLINPTGVVPIPGQPGQMLDISSSVALIDNELRTGQTDITLPVTKVPPLLAEPEPAAGEVQAWLASPFVLIVDDPLTGDYYAEFPASADWMKRWFRLVSHKSETSARLDLEFKPDQVRAWLTEVATQVGISRTLDISGTLTRTLTALDTGGHKMRALVTHPTYTYTVQPGDAFFDIAYSYGLPQWQLERANPTVDPALIDVGMVLTIPSLDVLFPHPLIYGKHIEVDLPEQKVRAYERGSPVFTLTVSSGMSSTPTLAGQFQVLFKEPNAYASRWALDMPYFMGIYEEREGFFNGFHELPITSYGTQLSPGVLGWPASFGCLILDIGDAEKLYRWAPLGTLVRIEGVAPGTPTWQETLADIAPLVQPPAEE